MLLTECFTQKAYHLWVGLQLGVQGILVLDARKGGPAWKSGIKGTSRDKYGRLVLGDIITALNGKRVRTASDLYKLLDKCSIGDKIDMEVCHIAPSPHPQCMKFGGCYMRQSQTKACIICQSCKAETALGASTCFSLQYCGIFLFPGVEGKQQRACWNHTGVQRQPASTPNSY